jgi:hypothetical protein
MTAQRQVELTSMPYVASIPAPAFVSKEEQERNPNIDPSLQEPGASIGGSESATEFTNMYGFASQRGVDGNVMDVGGEERVQVSDSQEMLGGLAWGEYV